MKIHNHRKSSRKRYRKLAAAVAGAAVLSSTLLPGLPLTKAQAATPSATYSTQSENKVSLSAASDPVEAVRDAASSFGFSSSDRFSLLSASDNKATVRVRSDSRTFKVDLKKTDGVWVITTIRGIGNSTTPATYTPARMFNYSPNVTITAPLLSQTLYQTNQYDNWADVQGSLPEGSSLGILLKNRSITGPSVSNAVLDQTRNIDFNYQFALFAQLANTNVPGYGIGISRVVQTGNDLTVTVQTLRPNSQLRLNPSKLADVVVLNRATLDFSNTIHVTFARPNGTVLANYTVPAL